MLLGEDSLHGNEGADLDSAIALQDRTAFGQIHGLIHVLGLEERAALDGVFDFEGPSLTILALPRTTLPVPSNRSPSCLIWPFFSSVSLPVHPPLHGLLHLFG